MANKALVVGATGLVGREVVKALLERDVPVKAASTGPSSSEISRSAK